MKVVRILHLIAAALVAAVVSPVAQAKTLLKGTVGPGFTISLRSSSGARVTKLNAGVYAIQVTDKSSIHDFHLTGPGVDKTITSIGTIGTKTVTVTLRRGRYTYVCDPHQAIMKSSFTVT